MKTKTVSEDGNEGLKPIAHDSEGPLFSKKGVLRNTAERVNSGAYTEDKTREIVKAINNATMTLDKSFELLDRALDRITTVETKVGESSKRVSGKVRDASHKLRDSMLKLDKHINIEKLERQVVLLERGAVAISTLAELEQNGRLDKLMSAMK